jgi:hypothetical protein
VETTGTDQTVHLIYALGKSGEQLNSVGRRESSSSSAWWRLGVARRERESGPEPARRPAAFLYASRRDVRGRLSCQSRHFMARRFPEGIRITACARPNRRRAFSECCVFRPERRMWETTSHRRRLLAHVLMWIVSLWPNPPEEPHSDNRISTAAPSKGGVNVLSPQIERRRRRWVVLQ